jgi:phosphoribosyl 1,2-cyclic phosphodiesterase
MSLSFCILASGSSGNCTLVICEHASADHSDQSRRCILIDAGLSPRVTAKRLRLLGVRLHEINAIQLTHLDFDHFHVGWPKAIRRFGLKLTIHVHRRHRTVAWRSGLTMRCAEIFSDGIDLGSCARVRSVMLAHDDAGSVGFVVENSGARLGYATDLGCVPRTLLDHFIDLDALAIESNYDRGMQLQSSRPWFLKRRIMGGHGHLSNEQALDAVRRIDARSRLAHVALLHLSRQCNDPTLVRRLYAQHMPHLLERLTITSQREPSPMLRIEPNRYAHASLPAHDRSSAQLTLFPIQEFASPSLIT